MASKQDPVTKLPKLNSAPDSINWRRRFYANLRRQDFGLHCFEENPQQVTKAVKKSGCRPIQRLRPPLF